MDDVHSDPYFYKNQNSTARGCDEDISWNMSTMGWYTYHLVMCLLDLPELELQSCFLPLSNPGHIPDLYGTQNGKIQWQNPMAESKDDFFSVSLHEHWLNILTFYTISMSISGKNQSLASSIWIHFHFHLSMWFFFYFHANAQKWYSSILFHFHPFPSLKPCSNQIWIIYGLIIYGYGWWYTSPSEKIVNWDDYSQNMEKSYLKKRKHNKPQTS